MIYLWFIIGFIIGATITIIVNMKKTAGGVLRIDHSNPKKDIYRFDVDNLVTLSKKKKILLKVDNNADLSQK